MSVGAMRIAKQQVPLLPSDISREQLESAGRVDVADSVGAPTTAGSGAAIAEPKLRQISNQASTASKLLEEANSFLRSKFEKPFTGYKDGQESLGAYGNVKKFNDAMFDHAATVMTEKARNAGIELTKDDVVASLRQANTDIDTIEYDDAQRRSALAENSNNRNLTAGDIDALTNVAIELALRGQDIASVGTLAFDLGIARTFNGLSDEPGRSPDLAGVPEANPKTAQLISTSSSSLKNWGFSDAVATFFAKRARLGDSTMLTLVNALSSTEKVAKAVIDSESPV